MKSCRPLMMDGLSGAGVGGARNRIKTANNSTSGRKASGVVASKLVRSSGSGLKTHPCVSSRSWGNSSFVTPCSTLYASPENIMRDLFWAFHPNRVIVPSFPLRFSRPLIPNNFFRARLEFLFSSMTLSGIFSISPAPNTGVGMRNIRLLRRASARKSGCAI